MQTCAKCSSESDKVVFKNKSRVDKDPKVKPIYWCSECISFSNRLTHIFKDAPDLRTAYTTLDKDALLQEYKQKNPEAIKAALVHALNSKTSVCNETTFKGNGQWLDEEELMEKYKSKPGQAQNIMDKARQFMHPTRGCMLYEDLTYYSTKLAQTRQDVVDHMKLQTNNMERLAKKIKVEKDKGPSAEKKMKETDNGKPLTETQAISMAKLQDRTKKVVELLDSTLKVALAEKLQNYIPRPHAEKGEICLAETRASIAEIEACLQDGWCGHVKKIQTNTKAKVEAAVAIRTILQTLIDAAEDGVNE